MKRFVRWFAGRVVDPLLEVMVRRLEIGPVKATAYIHAVASVARLVNAVTVIGFVVWKGWIPTAWIVGHPIAASLILGGIYSIFVISPATLIMQMMDISTGKRKNLGSYCAGQANRLVRSDYGVAGNVLVAAVCLFVTLADVVLAQGGDVTLLVLLALVCAVDAIEGVVWRSPHIRGLITSSLPD